MVIRIAAIIILICENFTGKQLILEPLQEFSYFKVRHQIQTSTVQKAPPLGAHSMRGNAHTQ